MLPNMKKILGVDLEIYAFGSQVILGLNADPEVQACKILGHSQNKIAHLAQKRVFWEISV